MVTWTHNVGNGCRRRHVAELAPRRPCASSKDVDSKGLVRKLSVVFISFT